MQPEIAKLNTLEVFAGERPLRFHSNFANLNNTNTSYADSNIN
jgi:hypothetical protein